MSKYNLFLKYDTLNEIYVYHYLGELFWWRCYMVRNFKMNTRNQYTIIVSYNVNTCVSWSSINCKISEN